MAPKTKSRRRSLAFRALAEEQKLYSSGAEFGSRDAAAPSQTATTSEQPKRLLKKTRKKHARPSSPGSSKAGEDEWIKPYPKTNTETALGDSDSDGSLRLGQIMGKKRSKELGKKPSKKPSKPPKRSIGKKNWNDGCGSDDDSSSISSESSVEEVKKVTNNKKTPNQSNIKKSAAQSDNIESKHKSQKSKTIKRTSFNKISSAGLREYNTPYNAPSRDIVKLAETEVNRVTIPEDITSVSQLQWYRIRLLQTEERTRETLKPCRILSPGDAIKQKRKMSNDKSGMNEKTTMIQYLTFPEVDKGLYKCVADSSLVPFGYPSRDGLSTTFNDDYLQRYLQQEGKTTTASKLEGSRLFLKKVFEHARDTEKTSRDQANKDLNDYYDDSSDDDDGSARKVLDSKRVQFEVEENTEDDEADDNEMDDLDVPYTQAITFDPDDFGTVEQKSNEPIRPGDVVEYYTPIFVAGDPRGLRQATVLAVDPKEEMPLTLSNAEGIPNSTKVKRIKVMLEGDLVDHPGIYRSIYRFKLVKKGSATAADAIAMEASRFGRIMHKNMSKLKEKAQADGFAPMDLLVNIKGAKTDTSAKAPSRTKASTTGSSRDKQPESLLSSSSDDSDDSSDDDNKKSNQKVKPQRKKPRETHARAKKMNDNKENNGTASGKGKKMSLRSIPSSASLGASLASSDDSSIESIHVELGRNHKKMTQHEKSASFEGKKANAKAQDSAVACDLTLSSDDDDESPNKMGRDKCKTPPKARSSSAFRSSTNSVSSESSLETPNSSGLRKKPASRKSSPTSSIGSSKRRLKLGTSPKNKRVASSPSPSMIGNNNSARKARRRRKSVPSSSSSEDTSSSSNSSRRPMRKQAKAAAETKSSTLLSKRSSSSDSVQIVNEGKSKLVTKKRPSPTSDLSSSDDSDDDYHSKPNKTHRSKSKKPNKCEQSSDSSGYTKRHSISKNGKESARELPTAKHEEAINSSGWTQGKAGWEKKSPVGVSGSSGFVFTRRK